MDKPHNEAVLSGIFGLFSVCLKTTFTNGRDNIATLN